MRFDDRATADTKEFAPNAKIIHIDIDPAEIGKNIPTDVPVVGDVKSVLTTLNKEIARREHVDWLSQIEQWRYEYPSPEIRQSDELLPQYVVHQIYEATEGEALVVTGVGQNQMWAARYFVYTKPNSIISGGGLGPMGFELPAAMGVKVGRPEEVVWCIAGDGGFQMTIQELATLTQDKIAVKIAIMNNGYLGMVRQWQELFYGRRYVDTKLWNPDFVKIAEAYDIPGVRVKRREEVIPAIQKAMEYPGAFLIDFLIEPEENIYPIVPSGESLARFFEPSRPEVLEGKLGKLIDTKHTLVALVEDKPGVLNRIASLFRRRAFNIQSLAVGGSEHPGLSRMTIVVGGDTAQVEQVRKQLEKLINVIKVADITEEDIVTRELALIKVKATASTRNEIIQIVDIFRANIVDVAPGSLTVEVTGDEDKLNSLLGLLRDFGVKELTRTGRIALTRGSSP